MDELRPNRNYRFSLYFTESEKQSLRILANDDKVSMAEEIRLLIEDEKDRRVEKIRRNWLFERGY